MGEFVEYERIKELIEGAEVECSDVPSYRFKKATRSIYEASCGTKKARILKILITNICELDCTYCPTSRLANIKRIYFPPDELAKIFFEMYKKHVVSGLFLSSGIAKSPSFTMQKLVETAQILRKKYNFQDYIHLKVMPGAHKSDIEEAAKYADRISLNLEAPTPKTFSKICPQKNFSNILKTLSDMKMAHMSVTTQFVVGASDETDKELLSISCKLYDEGFKRVYFSPFIPYPDTPLESKPPEDLSRIKKLYEADALIRVYGFRFDEIECLFNGNGSLPRNKDIKEVWASKNINFFPVNVNKATFLELLRIPGIGITLAQRIIDRRKRCRIKNPCELAEIGVRVKSLDFIKF